MIEGDPRQRVDRRLIIVDTLDVFLSAGTGVLLEDAETALEPALGAASVPEAELTTAFPRQLDILARRSRTSVLFSESGAGSIPRRVNLSDSEAKHLNAPSATW